MQIPLDLKYIAINIAELYLNGFSIYSRKQWHISTDFVENFIFTILSGLHQNVDNYGHKSQFKQTKKQNNKLFTNKTNIISLK